MNGISDFRLTAREIYVSNQLPYHCFSSSKLPGSKYIYYKHSFAGSIQAPTVDSDVSVWALPTACQREPLSKHDVIPHYVIAARAVIIHWRRAFCLSSSWIYPTARALHCRLHLGSVRGRWSRIGWIPCVIPLCTAERFVCIISTLCAGFAAPGLAVVAVVRWGACFISRLDLIYLLY